MNSFYILVYFFYLLKDTSGLTEDQLKCVGENHTPVLELEWKNPKGHNTGFKIKAKTNAERIQLYDTLAKCSNSDGKAIKPEGQLAP